MQCISVFKKYSKYSENVILLAIETMTNSEKISLKKGYGQDYQGIDQCLLSKVEKISFDSVDEQLKIRIAEVAKDIENKKTEEEILNKYKKKSNSFFSMYGSTVNTQNQGSFKVKSKFIDFFPVSLQKPVKKMIPFFSVEDKEILSCFYWGKNFDIVRNSNPTEEDKQNLKLLIDRIKTEAIKMTKPVVKPVIVSKKTTTLLVSKENQSVEHKKSAQTTKSISNVTKIRTLKNTNRGGLLLSFDEQYHDLVLKVVAHFEITNPNYYEVITKRYSGEKYEIVNDVKLTDREQFCLNNAKQRIKQILQYSKEDLESFFENKKVNTKAKNKLLDSFEEEYHDLVLKIVAHFEITNPNYYEVINKQYSGEKYEIVNDVKLTNKELTYLNNAQQKIKQILQYSKEDLKAFFENKKVNTKTKNRFLDSFDEQYHDLVLKIVSHFEITNPSYYEIINKKYSGEKYEIVNDIALTEEEYIILKNAKSRIKDILKFSKEKLDLFFAKKVPCKKVPCRMKKTLLEYFEEKDHELVLKIVSHFEITFPIYYSIINKRYSGEKYEIVNEITFNSTDYNDLYRAINKIKQILLFSEKDLNLFFEKNRVKKQKQNNGKQLKKLLEYFEEKDYELVLQIIEHFKITNPSYYDVINKQYSGERYEIINNVELTGDETRIMNNARGRIRIILSFSEEKRNLFFKQMQSESYSRGFLYFFDEKDHELVLEIIKEFQLTYPNYYETIIKRYSGEKYEIVNDVKLSKKENNFLYGAKKKIKDLLELKKSENLDEKVITYTQTSKLIKQSIQSILNFISIKSKECDFDMDKLVDYCMQYLRYLDDNTAAFIIKTISSYQPDMIKKLMDSSYFKNKLQYLTLKEQEYMYLTLRSYNNQLLTTEKINEILESEQEYLKECDEFEFQPEDISKLDRLFEKVKQ